MYGYDLVESIESECDCQTIVREHVWSILILICRKPYTAYTKNAKLNTTIKLFLLNIGKLIVPPAEK